MACVSDTVADFLTRIRNASSARHRYTDVPWSTFHQELAELLQREGYLDQVLVKHENNKAYMRVFLRYLQNRTPLIRGIKRMSTPGCRRYVGHDQIPNVFDGLGIVVLSTPQGVLIGREARNRKVGGELVCCIW